MRMWKLTEALNLDEATAQHFFPILHRYDERLQPIQRQQADLGRLLSQEVALPRPDPLKLTRAIDEIINLRHQVQAIEDERARELRRVLTPIQQARLILSLPRIEREMWRQVRKAMGQPDEEWP
jgi:hypothetical protein